MPGHWSASAHSGALQPPSRSHDEANDSDNEDAKSIIHHESASERATPLESNLTLPTSRIQSRTSVTTAASINSINPLYASRSLGGPVKHTKTFGPVGSPKAPTRRSVLTRTLSGTIGVISRTPTSTNDQEMLSNRLTQTSSIVSNPGRTRELEDLQLLRSGVSLGPASTRATSVNPGVSSSRQSEYANSLFRKNYGNPRSSVAGPASVVPEDLIPTYKPAVDNQDKLWSEIDTLDDVRAVAKKARGVGSLFGSRHAQAMEEFRQSQLELANVILKSDRAIADGDTEAELHELWDAPDMDTVQRHLFNDEYIERIDEGVRVTKAKLDLVKESLRKVCEANEEKTSMFETSDNVSGAASESASVAPSG